MLARMNLKHFAYAMALAAMAHPAMAAPQAEEPAYAVIDWPNKLNPDVVTLGNDDFLLLTDKAFVVWNALTRQMAAAKGWPRHTSIEGSWSRLGNGTVVAGGSHTDDTDQPFASLAWWNPESRSFAPPLVLPLGTVMRRIVPIDPQLALACMRTGKEEDGKPAPSRAILLRVSAGALKQEPVSPVTRAALLAAGVRGAVDDVQLGPAPAVPLSFDTASCNWTMASPPKEYAKDASRGFQRRLLPGVTLVAVPDRSDWPLRWDARKAAWISIADAGARMGIGGSYANFGDHDPLVTANDSSIQWFDPAAQRLVSIKSLPYTYIPILAPLSDGGIVVFLRENGKVLRLPPIKSSP